MKKHMGLAVALMMALATMGCNANKDEVLTNDEALSNENNELKYIDISSGERLLVQGNNNFAFNLFRQATLPGDDGKAASVEGSAILSPISITYALGMLNNGAAGETQSQINQVLGFGLDDNAQGTDAINAFCHKMLTEAPALDKLTKVMIANTIYVNQHYQLMPAFVQAANDYYNAQPETRNFADGKTMDVINQWASDHTEKMIERVLDKESFNPAAVSYLLNAIYFKGAWAEKFSKANTKDEDFTTAQGTTKVPMMQQEHAFNYGENELCQALRLPYGNGAYSMTILLPREGKSVDDVLRTLDAASWQRNYQWLGNAIVNVKLPRFESKTDVSLKEIMSALGMPDAFDASKAEFPGFCNTSTCIDMMKQVARIKLDEEGTEAAAVTVIGMKVTSVAEPKEPLRVNFHATRPFLYVISEQSTGAIFFIGRYEGE